jgi:radical SAM superfamily enzyme YgiQ (UPF0313 family)
VRALLVQAKSPPTYWGYQFALPFIDKAAPLPPLGLATLAALLPGDWEVTIHDLHLGPLDDETMRRAHALGKRTVIGGPAASTSPEVFVEADHVFQGEAEGRLGPLVEALEQPERAAPRLLAPLGGSRPAMSLSPVPRYDLLDLSRYATMAVQVSRGCPFDCEFCDIIEIFGRVPRVKSVEQLVAELEALHRLGARGPLFFVDDNFIGNRKAIARMLPGIAAWQRNHGRPFELCTEASMDLAGEPALVASMVEAGFTSVFVGIETPSAEALAETHKLQNLRMAPAAAVEILTRAGLEVYAGFIVGFDADGPDIFDRQREFIESVAIPRAMVGLLSALPGTALWRRLEGESRLRGAPSGDQFERPNFRPSMDERTLMAGYRRLLCEIYRDDAYYDRCEQFFARARSTRGAPGDGALAALARAVWRIGIRGRRRVRFWRLLLTSLRHGLGGLPKAVTLAVVGEHMIRYTEEVVLPRLDLALADLDLDLAPGDPAPVLQPEALPAAAPT